MIKLSEWWDSLNFFMQVLYCIAIPSAIILILQTFISLLGFGHSHGGVDTSDVSGLDMHSNVHFDVSNGMQISHTIGDGGGPFDVFTIKMFTFQGIIAFLNVFSWTAILFINLGTSYVLGISIGLILGLVSMFVVAKIIQSFSKLTENGTLNLKNAIGLTATVYIPIPGKANGNGKVTLYVQEKFIECPAITFGNDTLKTGLNVRVVDVKNETLIVEI